MKKLFLCAAVAFAAVAGTVCYNSESRNENEMSDLAKANVKALAEEEKEEERDECWETCYKYNGWMCTRIHEGVTSRCINARKL